MKQSIATILLASLLLAALVIPVPAIAGPEDAPSPSEMAADLVVARPVGLAMTLIGTAVFVVSLPFSALGGNIEGAADTLVVKPARETFQRCLGCVNAGRLKQPAK